MDKRAKRKLYAEREIMSVKEAAKAKKKSPIIPKVKAPPEIKKEETKETKKTE